MGIPSRERLTYPTLGKRETIIGSNLMFFRGHVFVFRRVSSSLTSTLKLIQGTLKNTLDVLSIKHRTPKKNILFFVDVVSPFPISFVFRGFLLQERNFLFQRSFSSQKYLPYEPRVRQKPRAKSSLPCHPVSEIVSFSWCFRCGKESRCFDFDAGSYI